MPCAGVDESPGPGIEPHKEHRDKTVRVCLVDQNKVCTAEDLFDFQTSRRKRVHVRVRRSHQDGRADSVSGNVGDDNAEMVIGHGEEVVVVSGGKLGRIHGPGNVEPRQFRWAAGRRCCWIFCAAMSCERFSCKAASTRLRSVKSRIAA